jgi:hypothetical protein
VRANKYESDLKILPITAVACDGPPGQLAEDEVFIGAEFPYITAPDGRWKTLPTDLIP